MTDISNLNNSRNVLVISSSGGAGHKEAAKAIIGEAKKNTGGIQPLSLSPNIVDVDMLRDIVPGKVGMVEVGIKASKAWDDAQKNGDVAAQEKLFEQRWLAEFIFAVPIFFKVIYLLIKNEIDTVVDTQVLGTKTIIRAVRVVNLYNSIFNNGRQKIRVTKVMTDMPTIKSAHFFGTIKSLSEADRDVFQLHTTRPLLRDGESEDEFWEIHCGFSPEIAKEHIKYTEFPLRPAFNKFKDKGLSELPTKLQVKVNKDGGDEEVAFIRDCIGCCDLEVQALDSPDPKQPDGKKHAIEFDISPNDKVFTIMLGSQAAAESTLKYVRNAINVVKQAGNAETKHHVFVFCNRHEMGKDSLFKKVRDLVMETEDFPENLNVIPLAFQDDDEIAPLYFRSNATITRSGGLTAMEIHEVVMGQIFIHSEAKMDNSGNMTEDDLLKGIPLWEGGNAEYLQKMKGAKIITPDMLATALANVKPAAAAAKTDYVKDKMYSGYTYRLPLIPQPEIITAASA